MICVYSFLASALLLIIFFSIMRFNSNINNLGLGIISLIPPFIGPAILFTSLIFCVIEINDRSPYEALREVERNKSMVFARDNKLSHWLFNTAAPESFWKKNQNQTINE